MTATSREWLVGRAGTKPVLADSRHDITSYRNLTAIKPNEREALEAAGIQDKSLKGVVEAARKLYRRTAVKAVVVTLGNKGMLVYRGRAGYRFVPAIGTDQIVDLTGAGDTAGAALITAIAADGDFYLAAVIANCAASVVVMKQGCACCTPDELSRVVETFVTNE